MEISDDFQLIFASLPACHVLLTPDFTAVAATQAYYEATHTTPQMLLQRNLFDVFPENERSVLRPKGQNLSAVLKKVLRTKRTQVMPLQRYNLKVPTSNGNYIFEDHWWRIINTPVQSAAGEVRYLINTVEDVTDMMDSLADAEDTYRQLIHFDQH